MTPTVTVATSRLRYGLLDALAVYQKASENAWTSAVVKPNVRAAGAHSHYIKAKAIGDLLDEIGWKLDDLTLPYELDIGRHGWAATAGLGQLIAREQDAQWRFAALGEDEAEAAGVAGGHRLNAERELDLIQAACEDVAFTIAEPES